MPRARDKPEEVIAKLRQVDALVPHGQSGTQAIRAIGIAEVTYSQCRREFGGLGQARRPRWPPRRPCTNIALGPVDGG
jgi:hypothetical protein